MSWAVLIVGCGMIAGRYDEQAPDSDAILSHAGAYCHHPDFRIAACVEPDAERRAKFMAFWNILAGFETLDEAFAGGASYDVVSVCTPTRHHRAVLERLVDGAHRLVFCEKPLAEDSEQAERLVQLYRDAGKLLAVNYTRRWDLSLADLSRRISSGALGDVQFVVAHYTKGVVHNGSHLIDLLTMLLGRLSIEQVLRMQESGDASDPAVDAILRCGGAPVHLMAADWRWFELFEVQIVTQQAKITIADSGFKLIVRHRERDKRYPAYFVLGDEQTVTSQLDRALYAAIENIADVLAGRGALACDGLGALTAQKLCVELRDRARHLWTARP